MGPGSLRAAADTSPSDASDAAPAAPAAPDPIVTLHIQAQQVSPYLPWDLLHPRPGTDPVGALVALAAPENYQVRRETGQHALLYSLSVGPSRVLTELTPQAQGDCAANLASALNASLISELYLHPFASSDPPNTDDAEPSLRRNAQADAVRHVLDALLSSLHIPTLRTLAIGFILPPPLVTSLATFLRSPRSRGLQHLTLHGRGEDALLPVPDLEILVPALVANGTVRMLHHGNSRTIHVRDAESFPFGHGFPGFSHPETRILMRLLGVLARNGAFLWPARRAAVRALVPARVILRHVNFAELASPPITRLPGHVLAQILGLVSGDSEVFDAAEWSKLFAAARDPDHLKRLAWAVTRLDLTAGLGFKAVMALWLDSGGFWPRSLS
ncbi:uncharacterized protein LOC62_04G005376 [Vanrija pseudolonga]|uniref:Uncharacterized protein n=1 Tax=Vanrija pseudolonga TaxID=143232 RepID=A0AAF0Y859_9TREE|nr:hypothetical protein LOC62_04G005376 [Vanrija pseudolonga]